MIARMTEQESVSGPPNPRFWQGNLGLVAGAGFFALMSVLITTVMFGVGSMMASEKAAYDSAPACASAADISGCRYEGSGLVVSTPTDKSGKQGVEVSFQDLGGKIYTAYFDAAHAPQQLWPVDSPVDAEVWHNLLIKVEGALTTEDPNALPVGGYKIAGVAFGAAGFLLAAAFAWLFVLYRRELARRAEALTGAVPGMQVIPLSPDITNYLGGNSRVLSLAPQLAAAAVVGVGVAVAVGSSILWIVKDAGPLFFLGYVWVACLGFGGVYAWLIAHDAWLASNDLARGVFLRASGPFVTRVQRVKAGWVTIVSIDQRKLAMNFSTPLQSVQSGTGQVDYLPSSGIVIEIRDDSGHVLWSHFARVPVAVA
jgi:hypothetical protein